MALEPRTFDLLLHLIRNRDHVVSKDELLESVWSGRIVSESTLDSRINAARKAIGDSGERQASIRTIARKGIRFVAEVGEVAPPPPAGATAGARASARGVPVDKLYDEMKKEIPMGRMGEADEAANVITFLASSAGSYVTGTSINLDGGMSGVL